MSDPNNPNSEGWIPPPPGMSPPPQSPPPKSPPPQSPPPGGGYVPPPPPGGGFTPPPPPQSPYSTPAGGFAPPPPTPGGGGVGTIDIGTVLSWAAAKYQQHAPVLLGLTAVVAAATLIGNFISVKLIENAAGGVTISDDGSFRIQNSNGFWGGMFGGMILSIVISILVAILMIGITRAALKVTRGQAPSFADLTSGEHLAEYIVTSIVLWLLTAVGLVLCIIPGLFVMFFMMMAPIHALDTGATVGDSISRSIAIVKANIVPIIVLVILAIIVSIMSSLIGGMAGAIVAALIQLLLTPFTALASAAAYRQGNGEALAA